MTENRQLLLGYGMMRYTVLPSWQDEFNVPVLDDARSVYCQSDLHLPPPSTWSRVTFKWCGLFVRNHDSQGQVRILTPDGVVTKAAALLGLAPHDWPKWADEPAEDSRAPVRQAATRRAVLLEGELR